MSDYISREEAEKRIDEALSRVFVEPVGKSILSKLPAADVKPVVRGKWIDEGTFADNNNAHAYMCSNCCSHVIEYPEEIKDQHFCYNCGADMEGDDEQSRI
jgi:hypothetical protein